MKIRKLNHWSHVIELKLLRERERELLFLELLDCNCIHKAKKGAFNNLDYGMGIHLIVSKVLENSEKKQIHRHEIASKSPSLTTVISLLRERENWVNTQNGIPGKDCNR